MEEAAVGRNAWTENDLPVPLSVYSVRQINAPTFAAELKGEQSLHGQ